MRRCRYRVTRRPSCAISDQEQPPIHLFGLTPHHHRWANHSAYPAQFHTAAACCSEPPIRRSHPFNNRAKKRERKNEKRQQWLLLRQDAMHRMFPCTMDRHARKRSTDQIMKQATVTAAASSERNPRHVVGRACSGSDATRAPCPWVLGIGRWNE